MNQRKSRFSKYKVSTLVILGTLLIASSAFAASRIYTLTNQKGDVVYEEKRFDESIYKDYTKEKQKRSLMAHHIGATVLKPGQAAVIYMAGEGSEGELYIREGNGIPVTSPADLRSKVADSDAIVLDNMLNKYKFTNGSITFRIASLSDEEESKLTAELEPLARKSAENYAIKLMNPKQIWNANMEYGYGTVRVTQMRTNTKITLHLDQETYDKYTPEELKIGDTTVLYDEYETERSLRFVTSTQDDEYHTQYFINVNKNKVSKQELLTIAEAFIQQ